MRSLNSREFVYVWNGWSNGSNALPRTMGNGDEVIRFLDVNGERKDYAARSRFYKQRVPEELYDTERDPGCRRNLIAESAYQKEVAAFRKRMLKLMRDTQDAEEANYLAFIEASVL